LLGEPAKIKITNLETGDDLKVQYNPPDYSLSKGAQIAEIAIPGLDSPLLQFIRGTNEKITLKLFFDTTDDGTDVREKTKSFYNLAKMDPETHAVPKCWITWGKAGKIKGDYSDFYGIVENISQNFTLFSSDGIPLRADLEITFREYKTLEEQLQKLKSYTRNRVVQRGETLSSIAADEYNDPNEWRTLAEENGIDDPRRLTPGTIIEIPPLED
jgi:nucleoid-associated protein YgaU